jgi:hypothetical protein
MSGGLDVFCRPLPLVSVAVLALNDHLLKGSGLLPSWLTGKLSDFCGLFFFPLLLAAAVTVLWPTAAARPQTAAALAAGVTAVLFSAIKLSPLASAAYEALAAALRGVARVRNVCDPTDLIALPMCALAVAYARWHMPAFKVTT